MVRNEKESEGYDREAYEYAMWLTASSKASEKAGQMSARTNPTSANTSYILKLEGPLKSASKIQEIAGLADPPKIAVGIDESGETEFCVIDSLTYQKILDWIGSQDLPLRPTIVRLSQSPKALDNNCMAPALGFDPTLPQHRSSDKDFKPEPAQDQYPVWYFFYGNLANADELQQRLGLSEPPSYVPAIVRGGRIRSWRGKYRALVDNGATNSDGESGSAYLVASKEHEDILRSYETEKYEVVRCSIEMEGRLEKFLVFRFAGEECELV